MTIKKQLLQYMDACDKQFESPEIDERFVMRSEELAGEIGDLLARNGYPDLYEASWRVRLPHELKRYLALCLGAVAGRSRPEGDLLAVAEVAAMLGTSPRTVWRMLSADELPQPVKIGGLTKWRRSDIQAMIDLLPSTKR